ncbi:hypothetical protein T492DRAFT_462926 [Pavlovales sp. CCMP2436]|nr:hypothetical protein T492DRAFT_462926 [Pavlovales sp. CCMP2436]
MWLALGPHLSAADALRTLLVRDVSPHLGFGAYVSDDFGLVPITRPQIDAVRTAATTIGAGMPFSEELANCVITSANRLLRFRGTRESAIRAPRRACLGTPRDATVTVRSAANARVQHWQPVAPMRARAEVAMVVGLHRQSALTSGAARRLLLRADARARLG